MLRFYSTALAVVLCCTGAFSQNKSELKNYPRGYAAGDVSLVQQWTESDGNRSVAAYAIDVPEAGSYMLAAIANLQKGNALPVSIDGSVTSVRLNATSDGWQKTTVSALSKNDAYGLYLSAGRHIITVAMPGNMPPLIDQLSFSKSNAHPVLDANWQRFSSSLSQWMQERPSSNVPDPAKYADELTGKVLANPEGNYDHAMDTAFTYSTYQVVYLTAGTPYTFSTSGSTKDVVLHLFNLNNVDNNSWSSDDYNGTWESNLVINAPATGNYAILVRPYYASQSGTTNLLQNGVTLLANTPIGGQRFTTAIRTGDLNYFTAKLTGVNPDTRIFTLLTSGGKVTGYNDDYANSSGGTYSWFLNSRIKKNYSTGSSYVFVCAYNSQKTGTCDVYMGNTNATLPTSGEASNFPLLKGEDAMQTAPNSGTYNCISWSGGITTSWTWPPDNFSTWYVANDPLAGFDKYYSNSPMRYPGAWNYTRSGSNSSNAVVDLWKTASAYTHASVTKPGNDNPHGYDWESKPGSFDRTLHPRNALQNANWYGSVSNYYRFTGTYAFILFPIFFKTDMDAVKAGAAVIDKAELTGGGQDKLRSMLSKVNADYTNQFEQLYQAWDKTKAANASLSDPAAYCNNAEYERLAKFAAQNPNKAMLLTFDKYVNNADHFIGKLVWSLTSSRYSKLLDEVKDERKAAPNDAQGRYKIHGDHDNGVLYIEKILKVIEAPADVVPADDMITVTVSPNPVKDQFTVQVDLKTASRVSVQAVSANSRITRTLQTETELSAGVHRFSANTKTMGAATGDVIIVQVMVNGVMHAMKVLVL